MQTHKYSLPLNDQIILTNRTTYFKDLMYYVYIFWLVNECQEQSVPWNLYDKMIRIALTTEDDDNRSDYNRRYRIDLSAKIKCVLIDYNSLNMIIGSINWFILSDNQGIIMCVLYTRLSTACIYVLSGNIAKLRAGLTVSALFWLSSTSTSTSTSTLATPLYSG